MIYFSLYRSVIVAPKKSGMAASAGTLATVPAATAVSVSSGTPIDSVAVVSSGDTSQSTPADSAGTHNSHTDIFYFIFIFSFSQNLLFKQYFCCVYTLIEALGFTLVAEVGKVKNKSNV